MKLLAQLETLSQHVWPHVLAPAALDRKLVAQTLETAAALRRQPDQGIRTRAHQLRQRVLGGEPTTAPSILSTGFALVHEAVRRTLGVELYHVQHLAGLALVRGSVAEMQTGEGKTLAAALAASVLALEGSGVHVVTTNSYLAQRDYQQLAPVYRLLGLSTGLLVEGESADRHRTAYACDITYGTGYEVGFDYLRDQLATLRRPKQKLGQRQRSLLRGEQSHEPVGRQRGRAAAIIDEIDSVLLDEGCMPLVLSEQSSAAIDPAPYVAALASAEQLVYGSDFVIDGHAIRLTQQGVAAIHRDAASLSGLRLLRPWNRYVEQALRAKHLLRRDVDYVVHEGGIRLVDSSTGRIFTDRSWRDGLQQLVEAREGLPITAEPATAVRISRQRYFRLYPRVCGMTGTATGTQREFWNLYRLPVVEIPLRLPSRRVALADRFFVSQEAKWQAIVASVSHLHASGRPVLVGTRTIADSEYLSQRLTSANLRHQVLNGRQDADEAAIVARAGRPRMITVATNMAGRGTDIKLERGVAELGGLHLIGAERNLLARVDRQLVGRVARQGDPGSFQFFVSAEDELVRHDVSRLGDRMRAAPHRAGELAADFSAEVKSLQAKLEAQAYAERRRMLLRDRWLEELAGTLARSL